MDEAWIVDVYRPCVGERSPLKGDGLANLLDRVLQFELDYRERQDEKRLAEIKQGLLRATMEIAVGFIDEESLCRWREICTDLLGQRPDWDRFGISASRHLRSWGIESEEDIAHFLRNIPDLLDQSIREVTHERLEAFQERARQRSLAAVREYLS
jgi:hypothetical protein